MIDPFFSVVIPTLNEANYIPRLLNSLTQQIRTNFEVWVVDGGSTDETRTIVKKYRQKLPIKLILSHERNAAYQRNLGAAHARGRYVAFFDADIEVAPEYLETLERHLIRTNVEFANTWILIKDESRPRRLVNSVANWLMYILLKLHRPILSAQNLVVKRSVFKKLGGFDKTIFLGEESEFGWRLLAQGGRGKMFLDLSVTVSSRRFQREGSFTVWWKCIYASIYQLFLGPIKRPLFSYQMGGVKVSIGNDQLTLR